MKAYLLTIFLFLIFLESYGQTGKIVSGDTTTRKFWYEDGAKAGVEDIISFNYKYYYRFWTSRQIVSVWSTDGITYNGSVISYTKAYKPNDFSKKSRFYFKKVYVDSELAKKAFGLFKKIDTIPTDKDIKGWTQGLDGVEYVIETSTPHSYSFKNYWTPTAQDSSLKQAIQIESFVNALSAQLNLPGKYKDFSSTLRPGNYTDGFMVTIKLSHKEQEYFKKTKPYRDYLNSINDTLNHYLSDTLTSLFKKGRGLACYDEFFLYFSKDNKLLKVTTNSKFDDSGDKKDFFKCKKMIEEAFRSIKIEFVHSQVSYTRELTFYDGKASVFNNSW